ncbi:tautomerase family protein [Pseudoalteromonas piscicida]|uniref:Tautomerase n=1 Tax=Pseudoalteromonas piscicida TaxID=43662 RepID=A0A2A5JL79_PSEO7|nr:4-oxalocrotonate tautomerase family protein [Pseudoalteromonas piscicida]PCK30176.1 4-oxalocrotonate tautomerase [Pseudoalteromonas piscicida]
MPIINIQVTKEGVTQAQKQALIKGATQLMVDVLYKDPQVTFVVIEEVETDNWGIGFDQVSMLRQQSLESNIK